ncbi:MAG: LacI family DNA-binding transcriptional regulator [Pseudomonadota bacterium]
MTTGRAGLDLGTPARPSGLRLADVARSLGVSVATVSNAFNRPDQLSSALRKVVLERAEELGYRGPGIEGRHCGPGTRAPSRSTSQSP